MPEGAPPSFAEETKKIAAVLAETLKPLGFRKRRNGFNRRLDCGLIHQLSIFSVGAYSIDHGKFYLHAGCYIPEAELYRKNVHGPNWVNDYHCAIRGSFPKAYLNIRKVAADPALISPHLDAALKALAAIEDYDSIIQAAPDMGGGTSEDGALRFETPQPLVKTCILLARSDRDGASKTLRDYLDRLGAEATPHRGHIEVVSEWAAEIGL